MVVVFGVFILILLFAGWFLDPGSPDPARLYLVFVLTATSYLVLLLALSGCATAGKSYPKEELMEKLSGKWKNTEYDRSTTPARRIIDPQGNFRQYDKTYQDVDERTGEFTVTKVWSDSEGLVWFRDKIYYHDSDTTVYELSKLDLNKMDWSLLWSEEKFPAEWDAVEYPALFYRK